MSELSIVTTKRRKFRAGTNGSFRRKRRRKTTRFPASANIKIGLLAASVLIVLGTLIYSHKLVEQLKAREYLVAHLFANAITYYSNAETPDDSLFHLVTTYARSSEVPVILTDRRNLPAVRSFDRRAFDQYNWNVPFNATLDSSHQVAFLREQMRLMDAVYPPIPIYYSNPQTKQATITNYVHYGNSLVLGSIESLPFIQLLLGAVIVFVGYLSFSYLKRSEQSNIWVGMAKETAHQLGTPLSSLLGWTELLRLSSSDHAEVEKIANEIDRDIERLNRIAIRFSKIGSIPDLKSQNVVTIVADVLSYFEGRMPHLRKNVRLELDSEQDEILLPINRELFEWVMENLVKNAFEAIESQEGLIRVHIHSNLRKNTILIDVSDTGKGIDKRNKNDVFRPGYSTKSRGWGLGLSLSRRIIEEYHHGRLFVKESVPGKGTMFRIRLTQS